MKVLLTNQAEYNISEGKCITMPVATLVSLIVTKSDSTTSAPTEALPEYMLFKSGEEFHKHWPNIAKRVDTTKPALISASGNVFVALKEVNLAAEETPVVKVEDNNGATNTQENPQE